MSSSYSIESRVEKMGYIRESNDVLACFRYYINHSTIAIRMYIRILRFLISLFRRVEIRLSRFGRPYL